MNRPNRSLIFIAIATLLCGGPSVAADEAGSDVTVATDLTSVIALQGMPCGKVVSTRELGENDYVATCQDGNRYRVFVDATGRVNVTKQ